MVSGVPGPFWGAVAGFTFVDFVGDRWFGVAWPTGPDFFPNQVLGVPLALCQLAAAGLMLVAGWKGATAGGTKSGRWFWIAVVAITVAATFVAYVLFGLWYVIDVMSRDSM